MATWAWAGLITATLPSITTAIKRLLRDVCIVSSFALWACSPSSPSPYLSANLIPTSRAPCLSRDRKATLPMDPLRDIQPFRLPVPWRVLVLCEVEPSLRVGCPAACGGEGHAPASVAPWLKALLAPSTCRPPHAAQRLGCNVVLAPTAKGVPAHEDPDPRQPSRRAPVLVRG